MPAQPSTIPPQRFEIRVTEKGTVEIVRFFAGAEKVLATLKGDHLEHANKAASTEFRQATIQTLNANNLRFKTESIFGFKSDDFTKKIPPRPSMNPELGDKTPEVFLWYMQYRPEEAKIRYGLFTKTDGELWRESIEVQIVDGSGNPVPIVDEHNRVTGEFEKELVTNVLLGRRQIGDGKNGYLVVRPPEGHESWGRYDEME